MGNIDELNRKLKDVNREIELVSSGRCPERSRPREVSKFFMIVLFMILLAAVLFFTYSRISGFAVIGNQSFNETNVTTNVTMNMTTNMSEVLQNITAIPDNVTDNITVVPEKITGNVTHNITENITETIAENITEGVPVKRPSLPAVHLRDRSNREQPYVTSVERESPSSSKLRVRIDAALESVKNIDLEGVEENDTLDITLEELPSAGTIWKQLYLIDFSTVNFTSGTVRSQAKGKSLYKCKTWNATTGRCEAVKVCTEGPDTKENPACHYEGGWQRIMGITPGKEYEFVVSPEDPVYAEYDSDFTAPYCSNGESPCIANTSLLACRDSVSDGNGPEPNQPNTIDSCADGTGVYASPSCGGDESVENITVTDLNGTHFKAGDTVRVSAWVNCYGATDDHLGMVYTNDASVSSPSWNLLDFREDGCSSGGYQQITFNDFVLDSNAGNHSVRVYITYDTQTPPPQNTCALRSSGTSYDDNDDLVFLVGLPNSPPTAPTSMTCDGGMCNRSFINDVDIQCSGSSDPDLDMITYVIDARMLNAVNFTDQEAGEQTYSAGMTTSVHRYNFGTCGYGTNCWAYENDVDRFPFRGNTANRNDHAQPTSAEYTYISAPNTNRWTTDDPGRNDEMFLWNEFNIAESPASITNMKFTFYGSIAGSSSTNFAIWLLLAGQPWQNDASWTQLGTTQSIGQTDAWMSRGLSSGFSTYIGTGGLVTWGVSEAVSSQSMRINFVEVNVTSQVSKDNDYNGSFVEYASIGGSSIENIEGVEANVGVSYYNPAGSVSAGNTRPDLEIGIWNGTAYETGYYCSLVSHYGDSASSVGYNCTVTSTDPSIISAWSTPSERRIEVRAAYLDTESGNNDSIKWTDLLVSIQNREWEYVGNHTQSTTFLWDISNESPQSDVDLRCRAIDLLGSNSFSSYFDPSVNLTILEEDTTPPGSVTGLFSPSQGYGWIYWSWNNPLDPDLSYVEVRVNGTFYSNVNTPLNYYNATGLSPGVVYEIQTRTADSNGNINPVWVTDINKTLFIVDTQNPDVVVNSPAPGSATNQTLPLLISVNVNDDIGINNVLADISTPGSGVQTIALFHQTGNIYAANFTGTISLGRYNITIIANDTSGNINSTETTWFNTTFYIPIQDNSAMIMSELTILADHGDDTADIQLIPLDYAIYNITIFDYNMSAPGTVYIKNKTTDQDFFRTYSIDLSELDFSTADVTVTSQGDFLYKCADFNFSTQNCSDDDNYVLWRDDLVYGQNYTLTLTPLDPGFGEVVEGPANISDAYFRSGTADTNYGALTRLRVGRRNAGNIIRGAVKFELPDLPRGAIITSAEVQLYFFRIPGTDTTAARTHGIYKVQQSPERNWTEMGVTWNNYTEAALWSSAGGDYNATPTDTQTLSSAEIDSFISYNVTGDVLHFYQNKSRNFGWVVRDTLEDINNARRDYRSKETGNAAQRPRLVINYTIPIIINTVNDTPDPVNQSKNITITANVTADLGVDSVWVEINDTNYSMIQQGAGIKRQFFDGFESGSITSNWTVVGNPGIYNRTQVTSSGCGQSSNSGTYFVLMDVSTNGNYETNVLKSTYDFTGATNIIFSFYHFDSTDELQQIGDHAGDYVASCTGNNACGDGVFFSCDGNYWYRLEALGTESSWTYHNINISADPNFCPQVNSSFAVKFMQHDNYGCDFDGRGFDDINITWIVPDSPDNWVLVHNTSEENGLVNYTVYANDTLGRLAAPNSSDYTVIGPDLIPPATVTNLDEQYVEAHWIQWSWTNPGDADFDHVEVWVNGTFYANVSKPQAYYNVTGLAQHTVYEIQTRTVDVFNNVNTTWVSDTARTIQANGSIILDKFNYEKTEIVHINGFDWDAGDNVTLVIEYGGSPVNGYPKNITPDSLGNFSHSYELLFNASLGLYNVSAVQLSNTSKNDLEQFNVSNFTGISGYQPLRAGVELYVYLPPLHNPFAARPEDPFLFVTSFNDNTSLYIEDQGDDGDTDDSRGNDTNRIYLDEGQSILIYIANGTDTDIDDGDYFHVVADKQVAVWVGSNSPFMSYTVPSESGKLDGEEFYIYGRYDPDFHLPLDMVINSYYDDTNVRIYDVTGDATNADGTNAGGYTNVTRANLDNLIANDVIDEGGHMTFINNSLTPGGHTFYVAANKPVTIIGGSVREGSDYGGVENFGRDGGFYAVGKDGVTFSTLFYTYVTRGGASLGEDEMYFFSDQTSDVTVETFWENGTLNETYNFQLNSGNDYFYALVGTNSSPYKKIVSTKPIAVLCGAWLNQGTGDMGDFGTSLEGGGVGMHFNIYVPEPGGTGLSHAILFAFYNSTYYEIYNSTSDALLASGTIDTGEHYDFTMMTDAHLIVNSTKNIAIEITNYDDNIGLYAVASPINFMSVQKTSDIDEVQLGSNVTYYVSIRNPTAMSISNLTIMDHIYNAVSYVEAIENPPLPGPIVSFNTPQPGITQLVWNKSALAPGEAVNMTIVATPTSEKETLLLNRVDVNGTEQGGDKVEGEDSTVVFLVDNSSPIIRSLIDFPDPQEINKKVRIEANITDNVFVSKATVNINGTNYTMIKGAGSTFYYNFNGTSLGLYSYTVYARDAKGNKAVPVSGKFRIKPSANVEPFVNLVQPVPGYTKDALVANVTFRCNATDNLGLVNISLYITGRYNQSFSRNRTTALSGLSGSASWNLTLVNGTYTWNCLAYDNNNNPAWSEFNRSVFLRVPDFTPPSVFGLVPPAVAVFNTSETIEIGANVTDYNDIHTLLANISYPNGTIVQIVLHQSGSTDKYNSTFTIPALEGVYKIIFIANDTRSNVNATETTSFEAAAVTHNVFGLITDSTNITVPAAIYVYNRTGDLIWTDDETYYFRLIDQRPYNITVMPTTGNLNEITYANVTVSGGILNFTRMEDSPEADTDKPDEIANWTEVVTWWTRPGFNFTTAKVNFSYGAGTDLVFWKCINWNFDTRNCTNNNFTIVQSLPDGPASAVVYINASDPAGGAGNQPDYNESIKVWDVTSLNETGRRDNGTFVGEFYDLEDVNLTIGRSYRFEVFVTQINEGAIGILRDPQYDNIQDDWIIDTTGLDAPNITQINGSVIIDTVTATIQAGSETGTQLMIWDSPPPHKTVDDMDANDTVKLWFVFDVPFNASSESHNGHFEGKSKGTDAEIINNLTTTLGSPPSKVNLTFPNNGNDTLVNRSLTFIWDAATDPDGHNLTYEINITSQFCADISDDNITATNYTPTVELGTFDECGAYNWTVRAYDSIYYGNWSNSWNFSIQPYVALIFLNDTVDFGMAENDQTNDTTDNNPIPLLIQSDGNVLTDVVNASMNQSFFTGSTYIDSDFQLKADNSAEMGAFNWTGSAIDWINLTTIQTIIGYLDWHDNNDSAEIDVKVHVPIDEPSGVRITGLVFYGAQS